MRLVIVLCIAALAGCQSSAPVAKATPTGSGTLSGKPQLLAEIANDEVVYECPVCQMSYDRPGRCPMGCADLVRTRISYLCPSDQKPVEHAGKCPRCALDAQVVETVLASESKPARESGR
jgi:protein-arginine kinase activator protein McsA